MGGCGTSLVTTSNAADVAVAVAAAPAIAVASAVVTVGNSAAVPSIAGCAEASTADNSKENQEEGEEEDDEDSSSSSDEDSSDDEEYDAFAPPATADAETATDAVPQEAAVANARVATPMASGGNVCTAEEAPPAGATAEPDKEAAEAEVPAPMEAEAEEKPGAERLALIEALREGLGDSDEE